MAPALDHHCVNTFLLILTPENFIKAIYIKGNISRVPIWKWSNRVSLVETQNRNWTSPKSQFNCFVSNLYLNLYNSLSTIVEYGSNLNILVLLSSCTPSPRERDRERVNSRFPETRLTSTNRDRNQGTNARHKSPAGSKLPRLDYSDFYWRVVSILPDALPFQMISSNGDDQW